MDPHDSQTPPPSANNEPPVSTPADPVTAGESTPADTSTETKQTGTSSYKGIIAGVLAVALLAGGIYWYIVQGGGSGDMSENAAAEFADDEVVATVNGQEVLGKELKQQMTQVAQMANASLATLDEATRQAIQSQSLDALINTELIVQQAESAGITVTDEEVETEFNTIVGQVGGLEEAESRLASLGSTIESFKERLDGDIKIRKYLEATNDQSELVVTEEEVQKTYDDFAATAGEAAPALADVQYQIEEQLRFQKQQEVLNNLITQLRQSANIVINI